MKTTYFCFLLLLLALGLRPASANNSLVYRKSIVSPYDEQRLMSPPLVEPFRAKKPNFIMQYLPEYTMTGPGYVCEYNQPASPYRASQQWYRNVGYRDADWLESNVYKNGIANPYLPPVNRGYNY